VINPATEEFDKLISMIRAEMISGLCSCESAQSPAPRRHVVDDLSIKVANLAEQQL
jgi:hypothetical protein